MRRADLKEKIVQYGLTGVAGSSLLALAGIVFFLFMEGLPLFSHYSVFDFLFGTLWYPTEEPGLFGIFPLLAASLAVTAVSSLLAVPLGVLTAEKMQEHFRNMQRLHWRQLVVLGEVLLLFLVGFLPQEQNLLANAIVSFSCAMQVQAFRKVNGYAFASTMCIGDLRSGVEALCVWSRTRDPKAKDRMLRYFGIILLFALGSGLGSKSCVWLGGRTIWISCGLLLVSFALMFIREDLEENPVIEKDLAEIRQETREIDHALRQELQEQQQELKESAAPHHR